MKHGLEPYQAGFLPPGCGHAIRSKYLDCLLKYAYPSYRWWLGGYGKQWPQQTPSEDVLEFVSHQMHDSPRVTNLLVMLSCAQDKCHRCRSQLREEVNHHEGELDSSDSEVSGEQLHSFTNIQILGLFLDDSRASSSNSSHQSKGNSHNTSESSSFEQEPSVIQKKYVPSHLKRLNIMKGCRNRLLSGPRRVPRWKLGVAVPVPVQSFVPINVRSLHLFDDYDDGPTVEDVLAYPSYVDNFPTNPFSQITPLSNWEYFKDYGYRILPDFATIFNQQQPILVSEHLLPIGLPDIPPYGLLENVIKGHTSIDRSGKRKQVQIEDVEILGLQDMLDLAGNPGSHDSIRAFVCGRTPRDNYICLRPERDEVQLSADEVHVTLDIDSVIWVTDKVHILGSIKVQVLPYMKKQPPISKDNHCNVEILWPQSDRDRATGQRTEWFTKSVPISQMPHIPFAQVSEGSGSFNIYIVFPRMKHRNVFTGYWSTLIPSEIQNLWLAEILIPAMKSSSVKGVEEYVNYSLQEWMWKATVNNKLQMSKTVTFDPVSIRILIENMRSNIKKKPQTLDAFGSFFFVMDARGIKLSTMNIRERDPDPFNTLRKEMPGLDWEHMMLRENGLFLLDLGISYHPAPRDEQPLIGLWRLNSSEASYKQSGMNTPQVFRCCTMARYGGMQARMETVRSRAVQLPFRSTYNLLFESVRRPGQEEKFCSDAEAYDMSPVFKETCKQFSKIYKNSQTKSYGVREEIRGTGLAIKEAIRLATKKVNEIFNRR
jgi:hypothetical protein